MAKEKVHVSQLADDLLRQQEVLNLINNFEIVDNNNNLSKVVDLRKDGFIPMFVSSHSSHADLLAALKVLNYVQDQTGPNPNEIQFLYAKSIDTGHQGKSIQQVFDKFKTFLKRKNILPLPIVRKKDTTKYNLQSDSSSLKKILSIPEENSGLFIFPEASIEGGRVENGRVKGLQSVEDAQSINHLCKKCAKLGKKFVAVPIAINGSHLVFSPDTGIIDYNQTAEIIIGDLLFKDDLVGQKEKPLDIIMQNIAYHLPLESRGIFK